MIFMKLYYYVVDPARIYQNLHYMALVTYFMIIVCLLCLTLGIIEWYVWSCIIMLLNLHEHITFHTNIVINDMATISYESDLFVHIYNQLVWSLRFYTLFFSLCVEALLLRTCLCPLIFMNLSNASTMMISLFIIYYMKALWIKYIISTYNKRKPI